MRKRKTAAALLMAALLLPLPAYAAQEEPAGEEDPAAVAAAILDRGSYTDGSLYANAAPEVRTVKIGLVYGEEAGAEAAFSNASGGGFDLGQYGEDRQFQPTAHLTAPEVRVSCAAEGSVWHVLLGDRFETESKAASFAGGYGGYVDTVDGRYLALYGSYASRAEAQRDIDRFRLPGRPYTADGGRLRVLDARSGAVLYTAPKGTDALALLPEEGESGLTDFGADRFRGGFACLMIEPEKLNVVNYVPLEDYVKGVIPYEMNALWPYEALRAQAVCARTYVVYNLDEYADQGFDITGDTYSQVYRGVLSADETTDRAVDSTAGQYVRYEGEICQIYYSAADGGATEDGLAMFDADRPYLQGKEDPFEEAVDFAAKSWTAWRSGEQLASRLRSLGYEIGTVTRLEPEYSDTENVVAVSLYDADGALVRLTGRDCYSALGLNSCRYTVERQGEQFVFTGGGLGHNCGMSQWGAYAMAAVYGCGYEDILRFYFTGAYIA